MVKIFENILLLVAACHVEPSNRSKESLPFSWQLTKMPLSSRSLAQCLTASIFSVSLCFHSSRSQKLKKIFLHFDTHKFLPSSLFFLAQKTCYFPCLRRFLSHFSRETDVKSFFFFTSSDSFFENFRDDLSVLFFLPPAMPLHHLPHPFLHKLLLYPSPPSFSRLMEEEHQHLDKPIYGGVLRNLKNTQSYEDEESMYQQRDLSRYYGLRENPKKKTQKSFGLESPEPMKKILFRCGDCGKGFRYEKCLSNHQAGMHLSTNQRVCEESIKSLCSSFSLVRKKKRSRVIRYKKTPLSCSFTTFLESPSVFAENDEELEVAECLILLSKSSPKFVVDGVKLVDEAMDAIPETPNGFLSYKKLRKAAEFESGSVGSDQKIMEEKVSRYETSNEPASFLGDSDKFDQQKQRRAGEFESGFLRNEQILLKEEISSDETSEEHASFLGHKYELDKWKLPKSCDFESGFFRTELGVGAMECSDSDTEIVTESEKRNVEHQCRLCNKVFSSYQALGGHQTFHRMSRSKKKKNCREESVEPEDEYVKKEKKRHSCSTCSRKFRSVHALGGHKKCHGKKQHSKTEHGEGLGLLSVVPLTVGIEFY